MAALETTRAVTDKERPDSILEGVAADAWQAYNAMETTKRRHFELLELLDNKKSNYNIDPSTQEQRLISFLLKDHDEQVKRFTALSQHLKLTDPQAHMNLFAYISLINQADSAQLNTH